MENYAYVLKPLSELYPDISHPVTGISFASMWDQFDSAGQDIEVARFDPL